jgi:hypothetical protein
MARDGSGNFTLLSTFAPPNTASNSTSINAIMADIATALTDSINKDGTKAMAAALQMGTNRITGLAAATALTDAAQLSQVQKSNVQRATTVGGTADAITAAFTPAITSLTTGMRIRVRSGGANTITGVQLNAEGLGLKDVLKNSSSGVGALAVGDIGGAGFIMDLEYDGTQWILLNPLASAPSSTAEATVAEYRANTADRVLTTDIVWSAAATVALTDAATIAVDFSAGINFTVTLGGNRTLGQPSNQKVGQSGFIRIVQDGSGSKTLAYHADWKFAGGTDPVASTPAGTTDILYYTVIAANFIHASLVKAVA